MSNLYCSNFIRTQDVLEFTLASPTASTSQYQGIVWNTTPTLQSGFPTYSSSLWSGSQFTPGTLGTGVYNITINYNMNGSSSPSELLIMKNTTISNTPIMYGTPSVLASSISSSTLYEGTCQALFNCVLSTDYINFVFNSGVTTSQSFCQSSIAARTTLRITKDASSPKTLPLLQTQYNLTFAANPSVPQNLAIGSFVAPSSSPWLFALIDVDTTSEYNSSVAGSPYSNLAAGQSAAINASTTAGWAVVLVSGTNYYAKSGVASTSNPYSFFQLVKGNLYFSGYLSYALSAQSCSGYVDPPSGSIWTTQYGSTNTSAPIVLNGTQTPYIVTIPNATFVGFTTTTLSQFILANAPIFTTPNAGSAWNLDMSTTNPTLSYLSLL